MGSSEKPLEWAGSSKRDLLGFPEEARRNAGYALGLSQLGGKHPASKVWHGDGPGVFEVVESAEGNAYRAVYTVRFAKAVYVLHCFQKKSPTGIKTAVCAAQACVPVMRHEHVARSRLEPGCLQHGVSHDGDNPLKLLFVEKWADMAAVKTHLSVPASREFGKALFRLSVAPPALELFSADPLHLG